MKFNNIPEAFITKLRLAIVASLFTGEKDFNALKDITGASDGNLSVQLTKLQEWGYLTSEKGFVGKKTKTVYTITEKGNVDFKEYVEMLASIIEK